MQNYFNTGLYDDNDNLAILTTPTAKQNGGIGGILTPRPLSPAKRSISKLSVSPSRATLYGKDYGTQKSLASLAFISTVSLIFGVLALQLLFKLHSKQISGQPSSGGILSQNNYESALEVTVAISSFVVVLDVCCVLVCSMQFFFSVKILKVPQGDDRAFKYLKECSSIRFISVSGFFVSIPALLTCLFLYTLMEFQTTPAIITMCITGIGVLFCIFSVVQNIYYWRVEKNRADLALPVFDDKKHNDSELSTLV